MPQSNIIFGFTPVSSWGKHNEGKLQNVIPTYTLLHKLGREPSSQFAQPLLQASRWLTYSNDKIKR